MQRNDSNIKAYLTIFHEMNFLFSLDNLIPLKWQMHFSLASDMELEGAELILSYLD